MGKNLPKVHVKAEAIKRDLKKKARPEHANFTTRFERTLLEEFRKKAEREGYSATQVLEALMESYLGK